METQMHPEAAKILGILEDNEFFTTIKNKEKFAKQLHDTYTMRMDLPFELRKMAMWLTANTHKRYRRYERFIVRWLNRGLKR